VSFGDYSNQTLIDGTHGRYLWLERSLAARGPDSPLQHLTSTSPELLLDKYVVVTSLDSGPLRLTNQRIISGWQRFGRLALSPRIASVVEVPFQWFDVWYIFDYRNGPKEVEVFVNYGTFALSESNPTIDTMYIGRDANLRADLKTKAVQLRKRFWSQLDELNPTSYVANGNCFTFVTRDRSLFEKVKIAFESF